MKRLLTLTDAQRVELVHCYKIEKNVRLRDRIQCVLLKADGRTNKDIAAVLFTSEHSVHDWLDRYDGGALDTLCGWEVGGSEAHLTPEQIQHLTAELDTHRFQTAKQVCHFVAQTFDVAYSERGVRELLHRLGYSRQKAHLVPAQADPAAQDAFLKGVCARQKPAFRHRAGLVFRRRSLFA